MDQGQGRNGTIRHCPAPSFFFLRNAEQRSKEPFSLTTKLAIIGDWDVPNKLVSQTWTEGQNAETEHLYIQMPSLRVCELDSILS